MGLRCVAERGARRRKEILDRVAGKSLLERLPAGVRRVDSWGKGIPGRGVEVASAKAGAGACLGGPWP